DGGRHLTHVPGDGRAGDALRHRGDIAGVTAAWMERGVIRAVATCCEVVLCACGNSAGRPMRDAWPLFRGVPLVYIFPIYHRHFGKTHCLRRECLMDTTRRSFLATTVAAGGAAVTPTLADAADEHAHDHQTLPSDTALRVKSLESLLVEKGLVDQAALDAVV